MTNKPISYTKGNLKINQWSNEDKEGKNHLSYTTEKFYKDKEGKWTTSNSFSKNELINLALLILEFNALENPVVVKQPAKETLS